MGRKVQHLQLLFALQGGASALETAAAEMQQAASSLVAIERRIGELSEQGVSLHAETLLACATPMLDLIAACKLFKYAAAVHQH